jgi:hypothetical protein
MECFRLSTQISTDNGVNFVAKHETDVSPCTFSSQQFSSGP